MASSLSPRSQYEGTSGRPWIVRMAFPLILLVGGAATVYYGDISTVFGVQHNSAVSTKSSTGPYTFVGQDATYDISDRDGSSLSDEEVSYDVSDEKRPLIAWLASYPNSGTSYTMSLVALATNLSTATNYGREETYERDDSIVVHENHPEGPFWGGTSRTRNVHEHIRELPDTYVMTKTHCGGRCVKCPATEYVTNATSFLKQCQRSHGYMTVNGHKGHHFEAFIDTSRIARVIHLIRNPFHNVVARYHLERHHVNEDALLETRYPYNAAGFQRWCKDIDDEYQPAEHRVFANETLQLMRRVPCRAEFFKYIQWHNRLVEIMSSDDLLFDSSKDNSRVLVVYYEDYETNLNKTAKTILDFLEQKAILPLRPFRALPSYSDHFSLHDRQAAKDLMQAVATPETWKLIQRYFDN